MEKCETCDDTTWVCEAHPDKPSGTVSERADACKCGPGMPCPSCSADIGQTIAPDMRQSLTGGREWSHEDGENTISVCAHLDSEGEPDACQITASDGSGTMSTFLDIQTADAMTIALASVVIDLRHSVGEYSPGTDFAAHAAGSAVVAFDPTNSLNERVMAMIEIAEASQEIVGTMLNAEANAFLHAKFGEDQPSKEEAQAALREWIAKACPDLDPAAIGLTKADG